MTSSRVPAGGGPRPAEGVLARLDRSFLEASRCAREAGGIAPQLLPGLFALLVAGFLFRTPTTVESSVWLASAALVVLAVLEVLVAVPLHRRAARIRGMRSGRSLRRAPLATLALVVAMLGIGRALRPLPGGGANLLPDAGRSFDDVGPWAAWTLLGLLVLAHRPLLAAWITNAGGRPDLRVQGALLRLALAWAMLQLVVCVVLLLALRGPSREALVLEGPRTAAAWLVAGALLAWPRRTSEAGLLRAASSEPARIPDAQHR